MGTARGYLARICGTTVKEESIALRLSSENDIHVEHESKDISFQFQCKSFRCPSFMA